jgi:hypothetical protein
MSEVHLHSRTSRKNPRPDIDPGVIAALERRTDFLIEQKHYSTEYLDVCKPFYTFRSNLRMSFLKDIMVA